MFNPLDMAILVESNLGTTHPTYRYTHVVVVEHWESLEADDAYRAWRATPEGASDLRTLLAEPPTLTRLHVLPDV